VANRLRVL